MFLHDSIRSNQANFRVQALVGMGRVFLRHPHGARGTMRDSMKEPRDKTPSAAKRARSRRPRPLAQPSKDRGRPAALPWRDARRAQPRAGRHALQASPILKPRGVTMRSRVFQDELKTVGIASSPSFVRQPEGNGCVERFIRTLKDLLLWLRTFDTVEELHRSLRDFACRFNNHWIIGRTGYRTPAAHRRILLGESA